jgi:hypothetical protein
MSKVPWHLFQPRQPKAHLVVGAIVQANGPAALNDSTAALAVLRRLAGKQRPAGDYTATVVREASWPEVYSLSLMRQTLKDSPRPSRQKPWRTILAGPASAHSKSTAQSSRNYRPCCHR